MVLLLAGGAWLSCGPGPSGATVTTGVGGFLGVPRPAAVGLAWLVMVVAMMLPLALGLLGSCAGW